MTGAARAPVGVWPAAGNGLRLPMLSIYYDCLQREGSLGAAPAMLLPLSGGALSLDKALAAVLKGGPGASRAAVWRIVRGTPVGRRYPAPLVPFLAQVDASLDLRELDDFRKAYRAGANLLGAALVACVEGQAQLFTTLRSHMKSVPSDLNAAAQSIGGMSASDFLDSLMDSSSRV